MKCERFLNKLEIEDANEEIDSNEDMDGVNDKDEQEDFSLLGGQSKKIKRAKNFIKTNKMFYIKLVIALLSVEAYYLQNYVIEVQFASNTKVLVNELNITSISEPFFWEAINIQRELYFNANRTIQGENTFDISKRYILDMYELNNELQQTHIANEGFLK